MMDFTLGVDDVQVALNENHKPGERPPVPPNNEHHSSFITGSRAYGNPRPDSDIDLVVLMNPEQAEWLDQFNERNDSLPGYPEGPIKIGKLELIICTSLYKYNIWKTGTQNLMERAPVTRDEAIAHFQELRQVPTSNPDDFEELQ